MKKLIATLVLVTSLASASVLATASPASATAYGCSWWNSKVVGGIPMASGQFCALVEGQRTFVAAVGGGWVSARSVANPCLIVNAWDRHGTRYFGTYSCRSGYYYNSSIRIPLNRYMREGTICASLFQNGGHVVSHCHRIQP